MREGSLVNFSYSNPCGNSVSRQIITGIRQSWPLSQFINYAQYSNSFIWITRQTWDGPRSLCPIFPSFSSDGYSWDTTVNASLFGKEVSSFYRPNRDYFFSLSTPLNRDNQYSLSNTGIYLISFFDAPQFLPTVFFNHEAP